MRTSFFQKFSKLENARKPEVSLSPVGKGVSGASVLMPATVPNVRGGCVCVTQLSKNQPCREKAWDQACGGAGVAMPATVAHGETGSSSTREERLLGRQRICITVKGVPWKTHPLLLAL